MKMQVVPTAPPSPVFPIGASEQMLTGRRRREGREAQRPSLRLCVSHPGTPGVRWWSKSTRCLQ